jgi:hypothetical protein
MLEVSVKSNPGKVSHAECGAGGYLKVKPTKSWPVPVLADGDRHVLRAAISGDDLTAWIDERVAWRGNLPTEARGMIGPAGIRSDNLRFDLHDFQASPIAAGDPTCKKEHGD